MGNFIFGEMQAEETQTASAYEERNNHRGITQRIFEKATTLKINQNSVKLRKKK